MKMKHLSFALIILVFGGSLLYSQEALRIIDYDYSNYPLIHNKFFVFDNLGNPILNLTDKSFSIRDNGDAQPIIKLYDCNSIGIDDKVSYTIAFDLGLDNSYHSPTNFSVGVQTANRLVNLIDSVSAEISLTSYDYRSFLNREFTRNKSELLSEISKFRHKEGSLFEAAFLNEPAGAFKIISRGENISKSIILITDGGGKYDYQLIADKLAESGAKLFVISIRKSPQSSLKDLCKSSGGWWFNLSNVQNINSVVYSIKAMSRGYRPCNLDWEMDYSCIDNHNVEILVPSLSVRDAFSFSFNNFEKSYLLSDTAFLPFSSVEIGSKKSITLTLTAKNRDILIQTLRVDPPFKIISGNVTNYLLKENDFISVVIEYTPLQKAIVFSQLEIISDACQTMPIYMTGGFPNTKPTEKTIKILHPNGGETLIIGDKSFVKWLGLLPKDVVQLEYSIDNGATWSTLATNVLGLDHEWIIPNTPSDSCLVKIIQLWPNNVGFTMDLLHSGAVNSAFFDATGDLVLTASSDTTAAIWISNTGMKKFNLLGHHKPVHWAVFDPMNQYIATASYDSLVIIWSQIDGSIVHIIKDHTDKVESVNFSRTGKYLVSSDSKGYSIIRDRNWNVLKKVKSNDYGPSWYTEFHPLNEDLILSANGDGKAKEWNWKNYTSGDNPQKIFDAKSIMCTHATYNTDGTKVAVTTSSGNPKKLYVWKVDSLDAPIYDITHNVDSNDNNSINFSSFFFHPDLGKEVLLTASTDQTARLWDAGDGTPAKINDFITDNIFIDVNNEHTNSISTAVFDRFGSRLLTSSWDSTAKIWNLNQKELQQDVSDSVFKIAYARGTGININMGTVYIDELRDSIIRAVFINESEFAYTIKGYKFSGPNANDFEILSDLQFPLIIQAKDSLPVEFRYYPKVIGLSLAELEFELPAGILVKSSISGLCEYPSLKLNYPLVDFGNVEVGSYKDSTFSIIMTNESGGAIQLDSISVKGSYRTEFTSQQSVGNVLQNNESIPVTLRFLPEFYGRKNAQYLVHYQGKGSPRLVNLFGEGIDSRTDSLMIYLKDVSAYPGEIIQVPIYIGAYGRISISELIKGFTTNLSFNGTLLEPLSGFRASELVGAERRLTIDLPKTFSSDSILTVLEFKALWGNDTISPLKLNYTVPTGTGRASIKEESASFKLKGVCLTDGVLRLFIPGNLELNQNSPNPASGTTSITFSVLESGNTSIIIYDFMGNEIKTLVDNFLPQGQHTVNFQVNELAAGVYYYIMRTPSNILYKNMLITR